MVEALNKEVLAGFVAALNSLVPAGNGGRETAVRLSALRFLPLGLGDFVGHHHDPEGEVVGRRLEAEVKVTVRATDMVGLDNATGELTGALVTAPRATLREKGFLALTLEKTGPRIPPKDGGKAEQEVELKARFEHLRKPTEPAGVIEDIVIREKDGQLEIEIKATPENGP